MNKLVKRLLTGTLAFATILTALPVTAVHASGNQYRTESAERVGYIEHVMNDGSIKSTFNEGHMKVEGETVDTFKAMVEKMFNGAMTAKGALVLTPTKVIVTTPVAENKKEIQIQILINLIVTSKKITSRL